MNEYDSIQTFLFQNLPIRGQIVRLNASFLSALATAEYPEIFQNLLGESLCAATLLSSIIKFNGKLSLQAQGTGPLRLLFAQSDNERHIRGIVHFDDTITDYPSKAPPLGELLGGEGRFVITLDPEKGERYQGIVELKGATLAECLQDYFHQSEQISTSIIFMVNEGIAAGLMLQRLPATEKEIFNDEQATMLSWEECVLLAATITAKELCLLDNQIILHRLFPTYTIQLFDSKPVSFRCSCSRDKIIATLEQFGENDLSALLQEQKGTIHVRCEFCNRDYSFDSVDITSIFKGIILPSSPREQ